MNNRYTVDMVEWSFDTRDARAACATRRNFVDQVNRYFGPQADIMTAELVLGELIGNVARYAPGRARVNADFDETGVTIAVHDNGTGFSVHALRRETRLLEESGRGLAIVARLAEMVEVERGERNGCCVRARLHVRQLN